MWQMLMQYKSIKDFRVGYQFFFLFFSLVKKRIILYQKLSLLAWLTFVRIHTYKHMYISMCNKLEYKFFNIKYVFWLMFMTFLFCIFSNTIVISATPYAHTYTQTHHQLTQHHNSCRSRLYYAPPQPRCQQSIENKISDMLMMLFMIFPDFRENILLIINNNVCSEWFWMVASSCRE